MSKPNWCPQEVWHATGMEFDKLYDAEPDLEGGCEQGIREMCARAILAAKAEEREAIASMLNDPGIDIKDRFAAVELVRKRGEVNTAHKNSEEV